MSQPIFTKNKQHISFEGTTLKEGFTDFKVETSSRVPPNDQILNPTESIFASRCVEVGTVCCEDH